MDGPELKAYERFKEQAQFYRAHACHLEGELRVVGPQLYRANQEINQLEQRVAKLTAENKRLKQQLKERTLTSQQPLQNDIAPLPLFVKPSIASRRRKKPGRKKGHPAALRPLP